MEFIKPVQLLEARVMGRRLHVFQRPGQFMGDEYAPTAGGDGRHNVRFQGIPDHASPLRPVTMVIKNRLTESFINNAFGTGPQSML